jgi:hypothetical protein
MFRFELRPVAVQAGPGIGEIALVESSWSGAFSEVLFGSSHHHPINEALTP